MSVMALNTLENCTCLRELQARIELSAEVMPRPGPLERMLEMAGRTVGQGDVGRPAMREAGERPVSGD